MDKTLRRSARNRRLVNYSRLDSIGFTEGEQMAANGGGIEDDVVEYEVEGEEFAEMRNTEEASKDNAEWQVRRQAVSDENFRRQYDEFQAKMAELNERELVIERETKLMEMKAQMQEREEKVRQAEREMAAKYRYENNNPEI